MVTKMEKIPREVIIQATVEDLKRGTCIGSLILFNRGELGCSLLVDQGVLVRGLQCCSLSSPLSAVAAKCICGTPPAVLWWATNECWTSSTNTDAATPCLVYTDGAGWGPIHSRTRGAPISVFCTEHTKS